MVYGAQTICRRLGYSERSNEGNDSKEGELTMRRLAALAGLLTCISAQAQCWRSGNYEGTTAVAGEAYRATADAISRSVLDIRIDGKRTSVTQYEEFGCAALGKASVVCVFDSDGRASTAVFVIDEARGRVIHTQTRSGFGLLDGGRVFVGRILSRC